ncbi:BnaCnng38430D [Brassica napus]|uniref:BnaCnng38430D protein n=1 Tax=Brassica napus TaxID=3708 RepID=A0A078JC18_BRANA|nr:BnaCnng38430D [Brassica napus]
MILSIIREMAITKFHLTCETASAPSNQQLTVAYIEMVTNVDAEPNESPAASLCRDVGVDGQLTTDDCRPPDSLSVVTGLKDDVSRLNYIILLK